VALKKVLGAWQDALHGQGWNALFLENHDITRVVSRWGDAGAHWHASATALATMYFLMEGTPFIYQGQEIGMTDTVFTQVGDFDDVFARNQHAIGLASGVPEAELLAALALTSRDNARTPMQWDEGATAGFSTASPWLKVNPNYPRINVARQRAEPDSVLAFYRKLIGLRRTEPALVYGLRWCTGAMNLCSPAIARCLPMCVVSTMRGSWSSSISARARRDADSRVARRDMTDCCSRIGSSHLIRPVRE